MKIQNKLYIVIDDRNMLWEKAFDFEDSGDYFDKDLSLIEGSDLLSYEDAKKWMTQLDKEFNSDIKFTIKEVELSII
jgi:hypothetical protein